MATSFLTRESFIPANSVKVVDRKSDAVAYIYARESKVGTRYGYAVFFGKQVKPVAHYTSKTEANRASEVARLFASRQSTATAKAEWKAKAAAEAKGFAEGDVLVSSWGYDQTNVDFYQIVGAKGSKLTICKIGGEQVDSGSNMSGYIAPMVNQFVGDTFTTIAKGSSVKVSHHQHASKLDFETVAGIKVYSRRYVSWYA